MVDMGEKESGTRKSRRHSGVIISASIILATSGSDPRSTLQYMLTKRSGDHPMLAGAMCFPGGTFSSADDSAKWRSLFSAQGINLSEIGFLSQSAHRPQIYRRELTDPESLPHEISLRITAIRETFEECGILLCVRGGGRGRENFSASAFQKRKDIMKWQQMVSKDPWNFLVLCEQHDCLPDLEALYEWNNWTTPGFFNPRFDTLFYIAILPTAVSAIIDPREVEYAQWMTAKDALEKHFHNSIFLPSPQFYEVSRLKDVSTVAQLHLLLNLRRRFGIQRFCPQYFATDGGFIVSFPGDFLFNDDLDSDDNTFPEPHPDATSTDVQNAKRYHRLEMHDGFRPVKLLITIPSYKYGHCYDPSRSSL